MALSRYKHHAIYEYVLSRNAIEIAANGVISIARAGVLLEVGFCRTYIRRRLLFPMRNFIKTKNDS